MFGANEEVNIPNAHITPPSMMTLANPNRLPRMAGIIANPSDTPAARAVTQAKEMRTHCH